MSKTDKTRPLKVRMKDSDFTWREVSIREVGGPGSTKWWKRASSKRNRRRAAPRQGMHAYGWGEDNVRGN